MLTRERKRHKLSHEILGLIGLSAAVSLVLFLLLSGIASGAAQTYCFEKDIPMTEYDWLEVDFWILGGSAVLSVISFIVLFLCLLGDRIAYIRKITAGIDGLHDPDKGVVIALEGNNELTALAAAINGMSEARQQLRSREQALVQEKEQLIRTLAHDIRTPLTSILAYSDYLTEHPEITPAEQTNYLQLIRGKGRQIRDLTAILLDGTHRHLEYFEDGRLLLEQIAAEFVEELEEQFAVSVDFGRCAAFSARLDVQELRRVFDNLSSNVRKYADPGRQVTLAVRFEQGTLVICQTNGVLPRKPQKESYQLGLNSIRRIAQLYGGSVTLEETAEQFSITVIFRIL